MAKSTKIMEVDGIRVGDRVRGVRVGEFVVVGFQSYRDTTGAIVVLNQVNEKGETNPYRVRLPMDCIVPV